MTQPTQGGERVARLTRRAGLLAVFGATAACATTDDTNMKRAATSADAVENTPRSGPPYSNLYRISGDTGQRGGSGYIARRAFVQLTRNLTKTEIPPTQRLDIQAMARRPFAMSWLGHSAQLLHVGGQWLLLDPFLSGTAGPLAGFGPARLTPLPVAITELPRIDAVLISHDHYDHLDLDSVRALSRQHGGPPRFLVGLGLKSWFAEAVGSPAEEHDWWQQTALNDLKLTFLPAQHNSGRNLTGRNLTLWGGWGVQWRGQRFYFAGDTAYVEDLFRIIRQRFGRPDVSALPIGAYAPQKLLRFDHINPLEAVRAHIVLGSKRSLGVHWGTLQLGDEEPFTPARDLAAALDEQRAREFGVTPIGAVVNIDRPLAQDAETLIHPGRLPPVFAS